MVAAALFITTACRRAPPAATEADAASMETQLEALRHKNRVLIVFAPAFDDPRFEAQHVLWRDAQVGFRDRDLVVLPARCGTSDLAGTYGIGPSSFAVVLVGKDGHTAFRSDVPVAAAEIFARIDAMPMRQEEMRQRGR